MFLDYLCGICEITINDGEKYLLMPEHRDWGIGINFYDIIIDEETGNSDLGENINTEVLNNFNGYNISQCSIDLYVNNTDYKESDRLISNIHMREKSGKIDLFIRPIYLRDGYYLASDKKTIDNTFIIVDHKDNSSSWSDFD